MAPTVQAGRITALKLRGPKSSTISSTVTTERLEASTTSFCTPTMPSSSTLPVRWHSRELLAGERAGDVLDARINLREFDPDVAAEDGARQPRRARFVGIG